MAAIRSSEALTSRKARGMSHSFGCRREAGAIASQPPGWATREPFLDSRELRFVDPVREGIEFRLGITLKRERKSNVSSDGGQATNVPSSRQDHLLPCPRSLELSSCTMAHLIRLRLGRPQTWAE